MKKTTNQPLLESDKQSKPMPGEVSPEEAQQKARVFATQEKARLKFRKNK